MSLTAAQIKTNPKDVAKLAASGPGITILGYINVYRDKDGDLVTGCTDLYASKDEAHSCNAGEFDDEGRKYIGVASVILDEVKS